jgi:CheY-like chemotaxis protein
LLAFSRMAIVTPVVLDLNVVVGEMDRMLGRMIAEDIELVLLRAPRLGRIKADANQLEQVILNLVINARDAMPTGGTLTLETAEEEVSPEQAQQRADARPGSYAVLWVRDTGCGMDEAVRARIFEPFFTTKEFGKGTGLGLAMVYGAVTQAGGHLVVQSSPGRGTSFGVYLPVIPEDAPSARGSRPSFAAPGGTETVLLVEDEESVLSLARLVLEGAGYTVLSARDGLEALEVAGRHTGRIDLLLTDVVMPRLGGRELVERMTAKVPELKVLFLSGYTDDAIVRQGAGQNQVPFLHKPFTPSMLARKVRDVLDQG